ADLFFTGNQVSCELYINKGDMKFKNITQSAGVGGEDGWCTGVTMVDINNDGWLDIYVCRSFSDHRPDRRANLLYVNNGDETFTEKGIEYGIADTSYTTQASFFDYDLDGDLDLYVGNHPRDFLYTELIVNAKKGNYTRNEPVIGTSDRLFRNNGNGNFTDVTIEAGVLNFGFLLGIVTSDLNDDGWPDIYVANDHAEPDLLYINNGDGTFTNKADDALRHMSNFSMGMDLADYNNDGLIDIVVLDMMAEDNYRQKTNMSAMAPEQFWMFVKMGFHYQFMRNVLQLNNGNGSFSEVANLAGISNTDWSWAALLADFDNDGFKDLFVANGYRKDVRANDYLNEAREYVKQSILEDKPVDLYEISTKSPETKLSNYLYRNNGDLTFTDVTVDVGLDDLSFSYGAAYADLDNDGDLDLVVTNLADNAFIYRNLCTENTNQNYLRVKMNGGTSNRMGIGVKVRLFYEDKQQIQELTLTRGFQSAVEGILHFGLGSVDKVDKMVIEWPGGTHEILTDVKSNQVLVVNIDDATLLKHEDEIQLDMLFSNITNSSGIDFVHTENEYDDYEKEILLPHKMSQFGPIVSTGDVNGDGYEDFFVGGAAGQAGVLYLNNGNSSFSASAGNTFADHRSQEDIGSIFFDADGDDDLDLYVVSGGNEFEADSKMLQDRLYLNDGNGNFEYAEDALPEMITSGSCIVPADYDEDGDQDLFVGGRLVPGMYPFPARSYILRNDNGKFTDVTAEIAPDLTKPGLVTSAIWTDFNSDGQLDIIVVGEWMPLSFYQNDSGQFINKTSEFGFDNTNGWWTKIVEADFDNDGDPDYAVGNLGLNYKYKASDAEPFHIYCHDFDRNGNLDIVLGYFNEGTCFPLRGRECSSSQMPFIKEKFPDYHSFGIATLEDVYGGDLDNALHYEARIFASSYIRNDGNGQFTISELPVMAQLSTAFGLIAGDFNDDDNIDLLLAGNFYVAEVETGRADAGVGLFLQGDGKGNFKQIGVNESGFYAPLDVRSLELLGENDKEQYVLVGNNDDQLQLFKVNHIKRDQDDNNIAQVR
ncbi:MAG: VCBS repeat-containing protein, partial [Bacteroidetes bacterium]|nr:VCBS repeat-containing protein [Bacteroidota bacterium]